MKLLGDDSLGWIGAQVRRRHVDQHRKIDVLDTRLDGIAEADIHRDRNTRTGQRSRGAKSRSAVLDLFADCFDPQALQVEAHPVVNLDRHDFAERTEKRTLRRVPETKQVHVARRAVWFVEPGGQQHRTLQHEPLAVRGEAQPMQQ